MQIYFNNELLPSEFANKISIRFHKTCELIRDMYNNIISNNENYTITIESIGNAVPIFYKEKRGNEFIFHFNSDEVYFFSFVNNEKILYNKYTKKYINFITILMDFSFIVLDTNQVKWKMILEEKQEQEEEI